MVIMKARLVSVNTLDTELNPICHFLALLAAYNILHLNRIKVKIILIFNYLK
jgi:hypothetical protein